MTVAPSFDLVLIGRGISMLESFSGSPVLNTSRKYLLPDARMHLWTLLKS
jgi:hypothetical protein